MPEDSELFLVFLRPLNRLGVDYMVTGSAASMAYGIPRVTLDIDLVLELTTPQTGLLAVAFPPESFYCPPRQALVIEIEKPARGHFNIIHLPTGFKADCYPVGNDPLHRWAMGRRRRVEMFGEHVMLAPPEYVIVRKLEYFREGGSDKHLRDIRGMLDVSGELIAGNELLSMIRERNLGAAWERANELPLPS
jgi:hypothetical protein